MLIPLDPVDLCAIMNNNVGSVGNHVHVLSSSPRRGCDKAANDYAQPPCPRILPDAVPAEGPPQLVEDGGGVFDSTDVGDYLDALTLK